MADITLQKLNLVNGDILTQEHIEKIDSNTDITQNKINENSNKIGVLNTSMENVNAQLSEIMKFKLIADINGTTYLNGQAIDYSWIRNRQSVLLSQAYRKLLKGLLVKICCQGDSLTYGHDTTSADKRPADTTPCPDGTTHSMARASITYPEAFQQFMQSIYGTNVTVINRGYSGDWVKRSYERWYTQHDSDITILVFGTNDSRADYVPSDIRGDIEDYINWYEQLIIREIIWGKGVIILTPPKLRNANDLDIESYSLSLKTMADKYGVPVIDSAEFTSNYPSSIYSDSVHFNGNGYSVFASKVSALFIGNGILNPYIIKDGDILLTRENLDSIKYIGNAQASTSSGALTPDESDSSGGILAQFTGTGGSIIYSFYTEQEDLMILPFYYSQNSDIKITLDFNTVSPRNTNDFLVDSSAMLGETLTKQMAYSTLPQTPKLEDLIKPTGDSTQPQLIRISEKGWHTVKIETTISENLVQFNSLAFMSYRDYIQQKKIQYNSQINNAYIFQTHGSYQDTTDITQSVISYDNLISTLKLSSIVDYWKSVPLKIIVYNYDQSVLEYRFLLSSRSNASYGWNFFNTSLIRYNIATTPTERTISSITYDVVNRQIIINWTGTTTRASNVVITV